MAASTNLPPWFETARIAAKCTQAAPAMARLLTIRPSVLSSCQIAKIDSRALSPHTRTAVGKSILRLRPLEGRRRKSRKRASSAHRIGQQACNRHWPDAARHRRERPRHAARLLERNVADDARLAALTRQPVDADVDHSRARLDPVAAHHLGPS